MADILIDEPAVGIALKISKGKRKGVKKSFQVEGAENPSKPCAVYVGRIPHGFYEKEMREFFGQFGTITKLRISRNKKTGNAKHYGFIKFEIPEVAAIVAESMNNYLLFESMLQVKLLPVEKEHPRMWVGANREFEYVDYQLIQKSLQNRIRNPSEQRQQLRSLVRKDKRRRLKLKESGIDFDYPDIRGSLPVEPKKVKFADDE